METNENVVVAENTQSVQPQHIESIQNVEPETQEQINWKKFREERALERKQKEAADKRAAEKEAEAQALKAAMDALLNKPTQSNHNEYADDEDEDVKIQKKIDAALSVRERQLEEQRRQREHAEFPQRLASTYTDFNDVCSTENLDYLEFHYPEVANAFKHAPDGFDKWSSVYKAVKRFVPNTNSLKDQKKAEKNFNKPQSMAASGMTQTGDTAPMQLDDKRRADNWARMQKVMKGGR